MRSGASRPEIVVLADVPGWAWARKAQAYQRWLSPRYNISIQYQTVGLDADVLARADLIHCFEVSQTGHVPPEFKGKVVAGLTAHVWPTWGARRMQEWAGRAHALHGNSLLLVRELAQFHEHVYYTPNGVDSDFWRRLRPRAKPDRQWGPVVVCHVGKPNPRKGAALIIEACAVLNLRLLLCQRTSQIRLSPEGVRELYQDTHIQVTMSDMDGTPNPSLESAACENMLISTRIGNMPEFIEDGRNGFLVERDCEALIERLAWAAENEARVAEMGQRARQTVEQGWTWEQQVIHVDNMWAEVLAS